MLCLPVCMHAYYMYAWCLQRSSHKTVLQLPARKEPQRQDVCCVAQLSARTRDQKHEQPEERERCCGDNWDLRGAPQGEQMSSSCCGASCLTWLTDFPHLCLSSSQQCLKWQQETVKPRYPQDQSKVLISTWGTSLQTSSGRESQGLQKVYREHGSQGAESTSFSFLAAGDCLPYPWAMDSWQPHTYLNFRPRKEDALHRTLKPRNGSPCWE